MLLHQILQIINLHIVVLSALLHQRKVNNLLDILHIVELQSLEVFLWNLINILAVLLAEYNISDTRAFSSQQFLFHTTNWQYLSAQGHLAGHRNTRTHFLARECTH